MLLCILLAAAICVAYIHVWDCAFVNIDDGSYVTANAHIQSGLTWSNFLWAFTTFEAGNWNPLVWFSFMMEHLLFGLNPRAYHATNLLLHIANTCLLFIILHRMTGRFWQGAFVAALFALHPLHVESVAWVSERKDLLCAFFWMLTTLTYLSYIKRPDVTRHLWVFISFMLGLMSKSMIVTLPFVLLLLDYWPLRRFRPDSTVMQVRVKGETTTEIKFGAEPLKRKPSLIDYVQGIRPLIIEKITLFIAVVVVSIMTIMAQQKANALMALEVFSFSSRLENALISYVMYIYKMFWPVKLAAFYAHPGTFPLWQPAGALILLAAMTAIALWTIRISPYLFVGWFWYLGTLVPVIGIVQIGGQSMADRYTYLPLIGIFIMIAWLAGDLIPSSRFKIPVLTTASLITLAACFLQTSSQVACWKNGVTLYQRVFDVNGSNHVTNYLLGNALASQGQCRDAMPYLTESIRQNPRFPFALDNLKICLDDLNQTLASDTRNHQDSGSHQDLSYEYNLVGLALLAQGRIEESIPYQRKALEIKPDYAAAEYNMANALMISGRTEEALGHYLRALKIMPDYVEAHNNAGVVFLKKGKVDEAIRHLSEALRLKPEYQDAQRNLNAALRIQKAKK